MRGVAKTRKRKNAFFDLAGVARIATRFYVGTGVIFNVPPVGGRLRY
jgi:hypothetical protein